MLNQPVVLLAALTLSFASCTGHSDSSVRDAALRQADTALATDSKDSATEAIGANRHEDSGTSDDAAKLADTQAFVDAGGSDATEAAGDTDSLRHSDTHLDTDERVDAPSTDGTGYATETTPADTETTTDSAADYCKPNPCKNGTCSNGDTTYVCTCSSGWQGDTCATDVNECSDAPCAHGVCSNKPGDFSCKCDLGWGGKQCDAVVPVCGDGRQWEIDCGDQCEECDDGNTDNTDACLNDCTNARCGDGFVRKGIEVCDDKNTTGGDYCSSDCRQAGWHTFYGSSIYESEIRDMATDSKGNSYLVGKYTYRSGDYDDYALVMKIDSSGSLTWKKTFGGDGTDSAEAVFLAENGDVYVAGRAADWGESPLNPHSGGNDLFVLKLNTDGQYQFHTFFASPATEAAYDISVDKDSNIYITGSAGSTWLGPSNEPPLHEHYGNKETDALVLKLDSSGSYVWHTFWGEQGADRGTGILLDEHGNIVVSGVAHTPAWLGPNGELPLHGFSEVESRLYENAFVLKLNNRGDYLWHTYYGGSRGDTAAESSSLDQTGAIFIAGTTYTNWDGLAGTLPKSAYSGQSDVFVVKLNSDGAYQWHTFHGSQEDDRAEHIALTSSGHIYVSGHSFMPWQGPLGQAPLRAFTKMTSAPTSLHTGEWDAYVLKLNPVGDYGWHTFYGSTLGDFAGGIALDGLNNVYVAGESDRTWSGPSGEPPLHEGLDYEYNWFLVKMGHDQ